MKQVKVVRAEYITLGFESYPSFEAFRGHLTREQCVELAEQQGVEIPDSWTPGHMYGRFIPTPYHSEYGMRFDTERINKRGNFPVTILEEPARREKGG